MKREIIFLLIIFYFLPKSYGENYMRRDMHGFDVIENIVGWIEDFRDVRLRMPETLDELFKILPNRRGMFEIYLSAGFEITYSSINTDTMLIKVQFESDLYTCKNKLYTYFFYLNGTLTREYTRDIDGRLINEHYYM